jgi:hypothetical protein
VQEQETHPINNFKQAIELIYDGIFKSVYFQNNRRELIEKMAERCEEVDPRILAKLEYTQNFSLRLFYVVFAHLKSLGMKVSFTKYRETVKANSGYQLKRSFAHQTMILMQKESEYQTAEVSFTKYRETVKTNSGYQLKRSFAHQTMILMQKESEYQTAAPAFTHFLFDENDNSE